MLLASLAMLARANESTLEELRTQLKAANAERDAVQQQVDNVDKSLKAASNQLEALVKNHAPLDDVQKQKKLIRKTKMKRLNLLTEMLKIEERRADLLTRIQQASPPRPNTDPTPEASNEELLARMETKPPGKVDVAKPEDFGKATESFPGISGTSNANIEAFQQELTKLKIEKERLQAQQTLQTEKKEEMKVKLADAIKNEEKQAATFYKQELESWTANEKLTQQKLEKARTQLLELKASFERFVASQSRAEYIMPGQELELIVAEDETLNGKYTVRRGGYIILPRIGRVQIAGKTRADAEETVKRTLEDTEFRNATVLLEPARIDDPEEETKELQREYLRARIRSLRGEEGDIGQDVIYLTGAFKKEGPWPIPKNFAPTLLTTIIRSGGVLDTADLAAVRVLRTVGGRAITETVDIKALMEGKANALDVKLQPNDVVIVPDAPKKRPQTIFVTGNVKNPGALELNFSKKITVYTAILKAGGFSRFADLADVYILRDNGDGKKHRIPVDLKKVKKGEATDKQVEPNDIIVVPESFWGTGN